MMTKLSFLLSLFVGLTWAGVETACRAPWKWAFTLDDGPHIPITGEILDILSRRNIKVTFFVVGNMMPTPEEQALVHRAYEEGHLIASHTMTHRSLPTLPEWEIHSELEGVDHLLNEILGITPAFFRPPYGDIDDRVLSVAESLGKTAVTWNVDSNDWRHPGDEEAVLNEFREALSHPELTSAISLSHDIHEVTLNTIERTLDLILEHGFELVRLDECLEMPGYNP